MNFLGKKCCSKSLPFLPSRHANRAACYTHPLLVGCRVNAVRQHVSGNIKVIMEWMAQRGLLHNTYTCPQCVIPCSTRCTGRLLLEVLTVSVERQRQDQLLQNKVALGKLMRFLFSCVTEIPMHKCSGTCRFCGKQVSTG